MKIIYYGIDDCEYAMITGRPALIAAAMVSEEYLKSLDFVQLIDGRWCHFMTKAENEYYIKNSNTDPLVMDNYKISGITNEPKNYLNYHGIEYCEYEMIAGKTAIIAPEGVDEGKLKECSFIQLADGRWCHYMDELETAYYVNHENTEVLSFPPPPSFSLVDIKELDNSKANLLTGLFVIIFLTGIAAIFFELYELSVICIMISFLLLTVTRILHPRHKASGTIAKVLSALFITAIIVFIIAIHILISALNDLADQTCDCVEGVGKIGAQYINFME